jgi:hypothetical protein
VQSVELDAAGGRKTRPGAADRIERNESVSEGKSVQLATEMGGLKGPAEPIDGFGHQKK